MEQIELYPSEHFRCDDDLVAVSELPTLEGHVAPTWLVDSVRASGVINPIVLADNGDNGYTVLDGRRRLDAARKAKLEKVPVRIFDGSEIGPLRYAWGAALNELRSSNHNTNLDSVYGLHQAGHSTEDIARATGLTVPTVKAYLHARESVHGLILQAFAKGLVRWSTVRLLASAPKSVQLAVVELYMPNGPAKLTARQVRELMPKSPAQMQMHWREETLSMLQKQLEASPAGEAEAVLAIQALIGMLQGQESLAS